MENNSKKEKLRAFFGGLPQGAICPIMALHGGWSREAEKEVDEARDYLYFFGLALGRAPWPPELLGEMKQLNEGDCLVFRLIERIRRAAAGEGKEPLPPELVQGLEDGRALAAGLVRVQ